MNSSEEIVCPKCFGAKWTRNGSSWTLKRLSSQEYKCMDKDCGHRWRVAEEPHLERTALFRRTDIGVFQAIAVYALGVPLGEVEKLTASALENRVKAETVTRKLRQVLSLGLWSELEMFLVSKFRAVTRNEMRKLHEALKADHTKTLSLKKYGMTLRSRYDDLRKNKQDGELVRKVDQILVHFSPTVPPKLPGNENG